MTRRRNLFSRTLALLCFLSGAAWSQALPPTIAKSFGVASIAAGALASLSFTITNPNAATTLTGISFTDPLPAGLVVSIPNGLSGSCGGGTIVASSAFGPNLTGAVLAANTSCTFRITVVGTTAGMKNNTTSAVTSVEGGTGGVALASVMVVGALAPPALGTFFGAASIPVGGTTPLIFTIIDQNAIPLTGVNFTDTLPAGLVVATPNGLSGFCAGTITAVSGSNSISLKSATVGPTPSCGFGINVTATAGGTKNNTTSTVTSVEAGTGPASSATIIVTGTGPATIAKSFGAASLTTGASTSLSLSITNSNGSTTLTGIGFTDLLPVGLLVASPNGLTGSCGGGTIVATAGSGSISLTGAALAPSASCEFSVNITATTSGTKNNTSGAVTSVEGGTGGTASASVTVGAAPVPPTNIPTLQQWALWLLGLLILIAAAGVTLRRAIEIKSAGDRGNGRLPRVRY